MPFLCRFLAFVCLPVILTACGGGSGEGGSSTASSGSGGKLQQDSQELEGQADNTQSCVLDPARQNMLALVNQARASSRSCGNTNYPAVPALAWSCTLEQVAYQHANDMGDHNFFSHTGSNGLSVGDRASHAGYAWRAVAENIAAGQATAEAAVQGWLKSEGHCRNIMNGNHTEMGLAAYETKNADYPVYWTQVLAKPR